ncbi:hypothetical protein [Maricaulis sp.]|uniref:hypothetical protein n=1 Tax=Maricaulis sp. TaxID=1486257 RepID=UPI0026216E3A|nr:hypothetical protein [Maricaulis sp.]MDF1767605.1 hypothetical protein [Maricaulis sp.]
MRWLVIIGCVVGAGLGFVAGRVTGGPDEPPAPPPVAAEPDGAFAALDPARQAELLACDIDTAGLSSLLALDMAAFDQDFSGGWRAVKSRDGCGAAAATVIEAYLLYSEPYPPSGSLTLLRWHAGQALASDGQYARARAFFAGSYQRPADQSASEWNLYVDGTLAFIDRDQPALQSARDTLAAMPVSDEERTARQAFLDDNPRISMPDGFVDEPSNLNILDDFIACWDRNYADAYGRACRH